MREDKNNIIGLIKNILEEISPFLDFSYEYRSKLNNIQEIRNLAELDRIQKQHIKHDKISKKSGTKILNHLNNLKMNYSLSDSEYFDIVSEIYQLNPKFFMQSLYPRLRNNLEKILGNKTLNLMDKYILEKVCYQDGEYLLYECNASMYHEIPKNYYIKVSSGHIYITSYKFVAQGRLNIYPYASLGNRLIDIGPNINPDQVQRIYLSNSEECYGYSFPIKSLYNLTIRSSKTLSYNVNVDNLFVRKKGYSSIVKITLQEKEQARKLFEILKPFSTPSSRNFL